MKIELIYDRDCPNVEATRSHLRQALCQCRRVTRWIEWDRSSKASPEYARRYGSPTVLIDGRDVVGEPPGDGSNCCRIYRDRHGSTQGVPPVEKIVDALNSGGDDSNHAGSSGWKSSLGAVPGIAAAFLPNLACPACWPAYAGLAGALGLGFLLDSKYLLALTIVFLALAMTALGFGARRRRGYGPLILGIAASAGLVAGKFLLDSEPVMYLGIAILIAASIWNAWPIKRGSDCKYCTE